MFDVSFSELMIIGVIALIVIGPERLPKVAKTIGHLLGRAQRYVNDVKTDIRREIELDELRKFKSEMDDAAQSMHTGLRATEESLRRPAEMLRGKLDEAARAAEDAVSGRTHAPDAATPPDGHPTQTEPASAASSPAPARALTPAPAPESHPAVPTGTPK